MHQLLFVHLSQLHPTDILKTTASEASSKEKKDGVARAFIFVLLPNADAYFHESS